LLHDLGKYREGFQLYLADARSVPAEERYHKQSGAAKAAELGLEPLAFAIAGDHGGMPDHAELCDSVERLAVSAGGRSTRTGVDSPVCEIHRDNK
jgi:hypothetical protein